MPKQIALDAIARGLSVTPLVPKEKRPLIKDWQNNASKDLNQIDKWDSQYPEANYGAVCSKELGNWILDIDDWNWYFEQWPFPELPKTFTVRTGSGGYQFHFLHSSASRNLSNKSLKNPAYVEGGSDKTIKAAFLDVLIQDRQGVLPGSRHPNGNEYKVLQDFPLAEITSEHLAWLTSLWDGKNTVAHKARLNPLRPGIDIEAKLRDAGLKFRAIKSGTKTYFNYHSEMGKCLIRGASHAQVGEKVNDRQSAFIFDSATNELYHHCFSAGCSETPGKTKVALAAIGLKLEELVISAARSAFRNIFQLDSTPLTFIVDGLIPEETPSAIGGLAGGFKSWMALSIAKAVINAPCQLWGYFDVKKKYDVLYLTPEIGDKSLKYRIDKLRFEQFLKSNPDAFLSRTFTQGETLALTSKEVLEMAKDRVVFLDTAICFMKGDGNSATDNKNGLRATVIALLSAGAKSVILLHHSPKSFEKETRMTLENVLRDTGDIGAMLGAAYGVKVLDAENGLIQVECIKPRDFEGPKPFQLTARPHIDKDGDLRMTSKPGKTENLAKQKKNGRPSSLPPNDETRLREEACRLKETGLSNKAIAEQLSTSEQKKISETRVWRLDESG